MAGLDDLSCISLVDLLSLSVQSKSASVYLFTGSISNYWAFVKLATLSATLLVTPLAEK